MPYKNPEERKAWERSPEQQEKALERKRKQREHADLIERLQAVQTIVDRAGHDRFLGPKLRADLQTYQAEIQAFRAKRDAEAVEVVDNRGRPCGV